MIGGVARGHRRLPAGERRAAAVLPSAIWRARRCRRPTRRRGHARRPRRRRIITVLSIVSLPPMLNAIMMIGTRILFAMGRDGLLWRRAATVDRRRHAGRRDAGHDGGGGGRDRHAAPFSVWSRWSRSSSPPNYSVCCLALDRAAAARAGTRRGRSARGAIRGRRAWCWPAPSRLSPARWSATASTAPGRWRCSPRGLPAARSSNGKRRNPRTPRMSKPAGRLYNARPGEASDEATAARRSSGVSHRGRRSRSVVHSPRASCRGAGEGGRAGAAIRSRSAVAEAAARTSGFSARRSASRSTRRITSGSSIAPARSSRARCTPRRIRRRRSAARRRRRFSSSTPPATWSATGAVPGKATTGRTRITASPSTTRATSGSAATAAALRRLRAGARGRGQPAAGQNRQQDESQIGGVQSFNDNMVLKFTQRRQVPDADREAAARARAATTSPTSGCRRRPSSTRRPTSCTSPTATAITA